jgi:hypothetical protein
MSDGAWDHLPPGFRPRRDVSAWVEPGRSVAEDGRIVYAWPPEGRFRALWERFALTFTDAEKSELLSLLIKWRDENSTLVAYTNESGEWVDVEPDWTKPDEWLRGA